MKIGCVVMAARKAGANRRPVPGVRRIPPALSRRAAERNRPARHRADAGNGGLSLCAGRPTASDGAER